MKKILLLLISLFTLTVSADIPEPIRNATDSLYSDITGGISTMYSDLKSGANTLYPEVRNAVSAMANGLGIAAEHVYLVLVKKYFVLGITECVLCLFGLLLFGLGIYIYIKTVSSMTNITYKIVVPLCFLIASSIILTNINYEMLFMGLINPECGAIEHIINITKSFIK